MRRKVLLLVPIIVAVIFAIVLLPHKSSSEIGCAGQVDEKVLSQGFDPNATTGEFEGRVVQIPHLDLATLEPQVLGESSEGKRIEVNLAQQRVYAYDGGNKVFEFVVSTGKWYPTPRGTFSIATKVPAQKMSGGNPANGTYYYLPNVPWVMFFGNSQIPWTRGFSLHGTYWHNNFGQPMSHGCVNMKIPDAALLYSWAPIGTKVIVY